MKRNQGFLIIISLTFAFSLFLIQSCKDEAVVETPPDPNQNPSAPKLVSPLNEATINYFTPALDWEDFNGAISYRIQISLDANFTGTMVMDSSGITSSGINIPQGLLATSSYNYWRVNASTSAGVTSWSAIWRFHIILTPPEAPVLISPPNGSVNQPVTPLMDWSDVPTAEFYRVQIATNSLFNSLALDSGRINVSQLQIPQYILIVNTSYYWRVNASNSGGVSTSPWSAPWSFTTMDGTEPNSISGTITFVDTNFLQLPGYYKAGAFISWPPYAEAAYNDSLIITQIGSLYKANYKFSGVPTGSYFVAVYTKPIIGTDLKVLGIFGCDTVHINYSTCPENPTWVRIINNWGVENINFLSWADSTQRIF